MFGSAYTWCKHRVAFKGEDEHEEFKRMTLYKGSGIPLSEKLGALRSIVLRRAQKMVRNIQREDKRIEINRAKPWNSTLSNYLEALTPAEIAAYRPKIVYVNEPGNDGGGLTREWLMLVS
jgi:hypothetical protein